MKNSDDGFTAVELLIVVLVLGILAVVVAFSVHRISATGQGSGCPVDRGTVEAAVADYFADNAVLPTSVADLEGYLRRTPSAGSDWTIDAEGAVRPVSGSECASAES